MKKLFISQPMRGLSDEEILKAREEIVKRADDEDIVSAEINMNGSGMIDFKIKE